MQQRRVPVSFLDLTVIENGSNSAAALALTEELARLADRLGFHRYWFAEHHNTTGLASASPEIMIAHVAAITDRIHVGSGGVMLPNHAPLRVAEAFTLLEALHPGRIDLGLGRAPGTDLVTAYAMRRSRETLQADDYPQQVAELLAFDEQSFPAGHPFQGMLAIPFDQRLPPIWLLGSSDFSARMAAQMGLPFSFAAHIGGLAAAGPVLRAYRELFIPSDRCPEPRSMLTVSVTVGDTPEQAEQLSRITDLFVLRLVTGQRGMYPTLEEALAYDFTPEDRARIASMPLRSIVGTPEEVHARIMALVEESGADEVMLTTTLPSRADRIRTLERMAEQFGLAAITPAGGGEERG